MAELENTTETETETPSLSGPFSPAEDKVIFAWEGTRPQLAAALGRTYTSVQQRQALLREKGLLP